MKKLLILGTSLAMVTFIVLFLHAYKEGVTALALTFNLLFILLALPLLCFTWYSLGALDGLEKAQRINWKGKKP